MRHTPPLRALATAYIDSAVRDLTPAPEAARAYLASHPEEFRVGARVRAHHLVTATRAEAEAARAAIAGRDYVLPDDIKALVVPTLAHRVILGPGARLRDLTAQQIVEEIMQGMPVPGGDPTGGSGRRSSAASGEA